jgi:hypothetical protein
MPATIGFLRGQRSAGPSRNEGAMKKLVDEFLTIWEKRFAPGIMQ